MLLEFLKGSIKVRVGFLSDYPDITKLLAALPTNMQAKINEYKNQKDKDLRTLGKVLLKKLLLENGYSDLALLDAFQYLKKNKPEIPGVHFSISYSDSIAVVALSCKQQVGIDVEKITITNFTDFDGHFHKNEILELRKNNDVLFLNLWTRKEALAKATGEGVFLPFNNINVLPEKIEYERKNYTFENLNFDAHYICTLCIEE